MDICTSAIAKVLELLLNGACGSDTVFVDSRFQSLAVFSLNVLMTCWWLAYSVKHGYKLTWADEKSCQYVSGSWLIHPRLY